MTSEPQQSALFDSRKIPGAVPPAIVLVLARKGDAGPAELQAVGHFPGGFQVAPFSVGAQGEWVVAVSGVADVHLFLRFDGEQVFASGLPQAEPAYLDGAPLSNDWVALPPHSKITFGQAQLHVLDATCGGPCCRAFGDVI